MSRKQMYDDFFRGSKYESKWLKKGNAPAVTPPSPRPAFVPLPENIDAKLAAERAASPPVAEANNPFAQLDEIQLAASLSEPDGIR